MRKFEVKEATKEKSYLKLALAGPSGSGKTYTGLSIMVNLLQILGIDQKPVVIDTEHGSASKYSKGFPFHFDTVDYEAPYDAEELIWLLKDLVSKGRKGIILDSASHFWMSEGGLLEVVNTKATTKYRGNTYNAFGEVTPIYRKLMDTVLWLPAHTVFCMRSKQDYAQETYTAKNGQTKTSITKLGMAPEFRAGAEYEMDIEGNLEMSHLMKIGKTRCSTLDGQEYLKPGKAFAVVVSEWLTAGVDRTEKPHQDERASSAVDRPTMPETPDSKPRQSSFSEEAVRDLYDSHACRVLAAKERNIAIAIKDEAKRALAEFPQFLEKWLKGPYTTRMNELKAMDLAAVAAARGITVDALAGNEDQPGNIAGAA